MGCDWRIRTLGNRIFLACAALFFCASAALCATTQYYYDDHGRIVQAISSDGSVRQYQYDENGNVVAINRISATTVTVSGLSPLIGHVGATVSIFGTGFSTAPGGNQVKFGAITATINSATATTLVVTVPANAVTGPISITNASGTAVSTMSYIVRKPFIASFSPLAAAPNSSVTIVGSNLKLVPGTTISVGGTPATITSLSNSQATITVPSGGSGPIEVFTSYGNTASSTSLIVTPPGVSAANIIASAGVTAGGAGQNLNVSQSNKLGALTFAATQDQYLSLQISNLVTTPSNGSFSYTVYSPSNASTASGAISQSQKTIHLPKIPATGTYLLTVASSTGTIQFTAALEVDAPIAANGLPQTSSTTVGSQSKRFTFTAAAGDHLGLAMTSLTLVPSGGYVNLTVYRPTSGYTHQFTCYVSNTPGCQLEMRSLALAGTYSIVVAPNNGTVMGFSLTLSAHSTTALTVDTPQPVSIAVPGQHARLTFTATAGQTFAVGGTSVTTTPANKTVWVNVINSSGAQIGSAGGSAPIINLPNLAAGDYTVIVSTIDAALANLNITLASGLAAVVPIGATTALYSTTLRGQHGYFTFNATAGDDIGFAATNLAMNPNSGYVQLTVYRPSGTQQALLNCAPGNNPGCLLEVRNLPTTGTYSIVAAPSSVATMSFRLTLSHHLSGTIALDTSQSFSLDLHGRHALYSFSIPSAQTVALSASAMTTTPANKAVWITVYSASGTNVGSSGSSVAPLINLQNLPAGNYDVLVSVADAAMGSVQLNLASGMIGTLPSDVTSPVYSSTLKGQHGYFTFSGTTGESLGLAVTNMMMNPSGGYASFTIYRPNGSYYNSLNCNPVTLPGCQFELRNLPATGTYSIVAAPSSAATMSFRLTLTHHATTPLAFDTAQSLSLSLPGQHAQFTFTATANQTAAIGLSSVATTPASKAAWLTVYNASGTNVGSSGSASGPTVNLPNLLAGTYTAVASTTDAAAATMQIQLASGMTGVLPTDGTTAAYASTIKNQQGYFSFDAAAGDNLALATTGLSMTPSGGYVAFTVLRPNGSHLNSFNCNAVTLPGCQLELRNLPTTGIYRVVATPSTAATMSFSLTLSRHSSAALTPDVAQSVNLGVPGQHARFTFTANAGQTFAVSANSISTTPASKTMWVTVYNAAGTQVANHGSATSPIVNLHNLAAGNYSVVVSTVDAAIATLQVTLATGVSAQLPINASSSSYTTTVRGQTGYFTFAGSTGDYLGLAITGLSLTPSGGYASLTVYRPNGSHYNSFNCNPVPLPGCQLELRNLPSTGTYTIVAAPSSAATISFTFTLSRHLEATLPLGSPQALSLEAPGQHARYTFTATSGQNASIDANTIATTPANKSVYLTVFNGAGTQIGSAGHVTNPTVNLSNLAAGTYTVVVNTVDAATATMQVRLQ